MPRSPVPSPSNVSLSRALRRAPFGFVALALGLNAGCRDFEDEPETYFEQRIAPILAENCVNGTANNQCHVESSDMPGTAQGNLDLSSFAALQRRPELLAAYGSYAEPVLLMKALKPSDVIIQYRGEPVTGEIIHAGGGILSRESAAFVELQQWLDNGANEDGQPSDTVFAQGSGPCSTRLRPEVVAFADQAAGPQYDEFRSRIQPILREQCSFGSCHGSTQSDFYLVCGDSEQEIQHNFIVAKSFVADASDRSELLLRPLSVNAGGVAHSGGDVWGSANDADFRAMREWAAATGPLVVEQDNPGFQFFADEVMPAFLKRGCAMPQCHSPQGFNDFRLRAGGRGQFSPLALRRNYDEAVAQFVSLDVAEPNASRILAKNVLTTQGGIIHRAGITLLEPSDAGGDPRVCVAGDLPAGQTRTAYCTIVEWIRRERERAVAEGRATDLSPGATVPIFYVDRPANPDRAIEFATFRGDARLMRVDATLGERGALVGFSAPQALDLSSCAAGTDLDIRGPAVRWDGQQLAFALRAGADDGLNLYVANLDGSGCQALTTDGGDVVDGVPVHNFDPLFVPPDPKNNPEGALVFASTRAGAGGRAHVSPRFKLPAANLWRMALDGTGLEQMTVLNGSELAPALMKKGQITMTTEKATTGLYQLAGRRINWDLTDYHPLLAQRDTVGFRQATELFEAPNGDFWLIASNEDSRFAGGSLVAFNRSIGPSTTDRIGEPGYLDSVRHLDPAAASAGQGPATGAYRSPAAAPDGGVLVSYAGGALDLRDPGAPVDYDLVVLRPAADPGGAPTRTLVAGGGDGRFQVDGVMGVATAQRKVFVNEPQLVFGGQQVAELVPTGRAWAHFPDVPMLATLLTSNNRGGRDIARMREGDTLAVYRADAPPPGATDDGAVFESWSLVGTAPLELDGSAFLDVPANVPVVLELRKGNEPVLTMTEEHQFGPGELTSLGVAERFFDGVCGGCHGSVEGAELDVVVNVDALSGASISRARPEASSTPELLR